jgi:hypothetical protein
MMGTAGFDTILYCNLELNKHPKHEKHDSEKFQEI